MAVCAPRRDDGRGRHTINSASVSGSEQKPSHQTFEYPGLWGVDKSVLVSAADVAVLATNVAELRHR